MKFLTGFESFVGVNFWTCLFTLVNLFILYKFMKKLLFKPVQNMIDSRQKEIDDLYADGADYQIGVQQDTTGDIYCSDDFGDDHVQRFNKGADAVAALVSGKLDCVVIDNEPAKSFVAANEGLKVLDTAYAVEDYAAAFAKGSELTEPFNQVLEELIADGTVKTIVDKYISAN